MALSLVLLVALVAAVLAVLGVFAWVLLAPLARAGRRDEETEATAQPTALFHRPVSAPRTAPAAVPAIEVQAVPVPRPVAPPEPVAPSAPPADVLLVTGDADLSRSQLAVLAAGGCATRCAVSATDAVGALRLRIPDLLLVDATGAEGVDLLAALRAWQATEELPVVLFTGVPDEETRRRAADLGVTDVVVDPQRMPDLVERALPYWLAGVGVFSSVG